MINNLVLVWHILIHVFRIYSYILFKRGVFDTIDLSVKMDAAEGVFNLHKKMCL